MSTVLISGSPHTDGCSEKMARAYIDAHLADEEIIHFSAYDMKVEPCLACGACATADCCIYDDIMDSFLDAVLQSERLIIASPVYFLTFPSPLMSVVDRLQRLHESLKRGNSPFTKKSREAVVLLSAGAPSEKGNVIASQLRWALPCINAELTEMIVIAGTDRMTAEEFNTALEAKIRG